MVRAFSAGFIVWLGLGCSGPPPGPNSPERVPLRHLAVLYGKYRYAHRGQPPRDESQFQQFIKSLDDKQLAAAGVSSAEVDSLFASPRDGQPYDVRYNDPPSPEAVVVMERAGKDGKRLVAYSTGKVEELDETQYQKVRFTRP